MHNIMYTRKYIIVSHEYEIFFKYGNYMILILLMSNYQIEHQMSCQI